MRRLVVCLLAAIGGYVVFSYLPILSHFSTRTLFQAEGVQVSYRMTFALAIAVLAAGMGRD